VDRRAGPHTHLLERWSQKATLRCLGSRRVAGVAFCCCLPKYLWMGGLPPSRTGPGRYWASTHEQAFPHRRFAVGNACRFVPGQRTAGAITPDALAFLIGGDNARASITAGPQALGPNQGCQLAMAKRRFPQPLTADETDACFILLESTRKL
jgi:hypothetical protein